MSAATISMITTKLLNCSRSICQNVVGGASISWLGPIFASRRWASSEDKPASENVSRRASTASVAMACQESPSIIVEVSDEVSFLNAIAFSNDKYLILRTYAVAGIEGGGVRGVAAPQHPPPFLL